MQADLRVALAIGLFQALLHFLAWWKSADPRLIGPHVVALLHDLFILALVVCVARLLRRTLRQSARRAGERVSIGLLVGTGMALAIYPQMLREYLAFPVNVFVASADSTWVMLREYLGIGRLWPALAAVAAAAVALKWPLGTRLRGRTATAAFGLAAVAALFTLPHSPHPWIFSIRQTAAGFLFPQVREVQSLERPPGRGEEAVHHDLAITIPDGPDAPKHIFLIVLEGITSADFEREFLDAPGGFHSAHRHESVYFSRYHSTNLDSYTSLIAMLTGLHVPYRAYADENRYVAVNLAHNLARALRGAGFFTAFVSTFAHQPFVPIRGDWDEILDRSSLPSLDGWVSLGTSRMEAATEDRAAIPTILDLTAAHDKSFILHEMVYGHSTEWQATTGQSPLSYYDRYLRELAQELARRGLLDTSLFVVVSDHGDRARSSEAENYRVPLLVAGRGVEGGTDAVFRSHQDLPAIVAAVMGGTGLPPQRESQFVVGSTERWVYGRLRSDGTHIFVDDPTGAVTARKGTETAAAVRDAFQAFLDWFGTSFGPRA